MHQPASDKSIINRAAAKFRGAVVGLFAHRPGSAGFPFDLVGAASLAWAALLFAATMELSYILR